MSRLSVAALLLLLGSIGAGPAVAQGCHRHKLAPSPSWISSGAFTGKGDVLLLADPAQGALLPFARQDGRLLAALPPQLSRSLQSVWPQVIHQGDHLHLEVAQNKFLTLGADYSYKNKKTIEAETKGGLKIRGVFLWQPVRSDFLAFSDVQMANQDWWSGFIRFPSDNPAAFEVLHWVPLRDPVRTFYRLGHPYIASLGDDGYVLVMDNNPGVFRNRKGRKDLEPLGALSGILGQSPILPLFGTRGDFAQVMAKVEQSKMPVGLYGWKEFLYLVVRQPGKSETQWTIFKIKPEGKGEVVGFSQIPAHAHHLTVVPGPKNWAFIEKGPVEGWGRQRVSNVLFVPSDRFENDMPRILCSQQELSP